MAKIIFTDNGIPFFGKTPRTRSIGGAQTAFIYLAEALVKNGHEVKVFNNCEEEGEFNGVVWQDIRQIQVEKCDLHIANQNPALISLVRKTRHKMFWFHNPANYLLKFRNLRRLLWWRPTMVFSSNYHMTTLPDWVPCGKRVKIPYGISSEFLGHQIRFNPPKPKVIFTSNPQRSLDWLLDLWEKRIHPMVPSGELHIFSSPETYASFGKKKAALMNAPLAKARELAMSGVVVRDVLSKQELAKEIYESRAVLYRGDPGETFCLALGESQAMGVPAIIQNIGCVSERIIDGKTGFVENDDDSFARRAIEVLTNDRRWQDLHHSALENQSRWTWDKAAAEFLRVAEL